MSGRQTSSVRKLCKFCGTFRNLRAFARRDERRGMIAHASSRDAHAEPATEAGYAAAAAPRGLRALAARGGASNGSDRSGRVPRPTVRTVERDQIAAPEERRTIREQIVAIASNAGPGQEDPGVCLDLQGMSNVQVVLPVMPENPNTSASIST